MAQQIYVLLLHECFSAHLVLLPKFTNPVSQLCSVCAVLAPVQVSFAGVPTAQQPCIHHVHMLSACKLVHITFAVVLTSCWYHCKCSSMKN